MSRIGKQPIEIPGGVTVDIASRVITAKGPLGESKLTLLDGVNVQLESNIINVVK